MQKNSTDFWRDTKLLKSFVPQSPFYPLFLLSVGDFRERENEGLKGLGKQPQNGDLGTNFHGL